MYVGCDYHVIDKHHVYPDADHEEKALKAERKQSAQEVVACLSPFLIDMSRGAN